MERYVIDPILAANSCGMICGHAGGKTGVALRIAHAVSTGGKCFVWEVPQRRAVLYVNSGLRPEAMTERLKKLRLNESSALRLLLCNTTTAAGRAEIEKHLSIGCLLVLDTPGMESADNFVEWLSKISSSGISTIFVNSTNKAGDPRGSSQICDFLDFVLEVRQAPSFHPTQALRTEIQLMKIRGANPVDTSAIDVTVPV